VAAGRDVHPTDALRQLTRRRNPIFRRWCDVEPSLHDAGAQPRKLGIADRPFLFQPIELFDFIGGTVTNRASLSITFNF